MERGDPTLYYGTKKLYFEHVNFKLTAPPPHPTTRRRVTKIRLRKMRVKKPHVMICKEVNINKFNSISHLLVIM